MFSGAILKYISSLSNLYDQHVKLINTLSINCLHIFKTNYNKRKIHPWSPSVSPQLILCPPQGCPPAVSWSFSCSRLNISSNFLLNLIRIATEYFSSFAPIDKNTFTCSQQHQKNLYEKGSKLYTHIHLYQWCVKRHNSCLNDYILLMRSWGRFDDIETGDYNDHANNANYNNANNH